MAVPAADYEDFATVRAAIEQFRELGGSEFVAEMVELLNQQTPQQFAAIDAALNGGDIGIAQRHAHSMKSSFGNFGASKCQNLAINMDRAGKDGDVSAYRISYEQLKPEFAKLQAILAELTSAAG